MLQNIGKADKSNDSIFQMYELNFYKQHNQASKLFKLFKAHYKSLKSSQESGRNLNVCIEEISADYQVARHDIICDGLSNLESLREAHMDKLRQRILYDLSQFSNNFANLKEKIAKRRRKQIDHDAAKRLYELALNELNKKRANDAGGNNNATDNGSMQDQQQSSSSLADKVKSIFNRSSHRVELAGNELGANGAALESAASRLVEEARVLKLREQYNYCKIMFESVNSELCDELPMLYECKMKQLLSLLHSYFSLGAKYHSECSKLMSSCGHAIEELPFALIARHPNQHQSGASSQASLATAAANNNNNNGSHQSRHDNNNRTLTASTDEFADDDDGLDDDDDSSSIMSESNQEIEDNNQIIAGRDDATSRQQRIVSQTDQPPFNDIGDISPAAVEIQQQKPEVVVDGEKIVAVSAKSSGSSSSSGNSSRGDSASVSGQGSPDHNRPVEGRADIEDKVDSDIKLVNGSFHKQQEIDVAKHADAVDDNNNDVSIEGKLEDLATDTAPPAVVVGAGPTSADFGKTNLTKGQSLAADRSMKIAQVNAAPPPPPSSQSDVKLSDTSNPTITVSQIKPLYKVKTQFKYLAEDVDELCFEADEIIQVIEFEPSQEPEEGWLMGIREVNGQKGLFPANFTNPI